MKKFKLITRLDGIYHPDWEKELSDVRSDKLFTATYFISMNAWWNLGPFWKYSSNLPDLKVFYLFGLIEITTFDQVTKWDSTDWTKMFNFLEYWINGADVRQAILDRVFFTDCSLLVLSRIIISFLNTDKFKSIIQASIS